MTKIRYLKYINKIINISITMLISECKSPASNEVKK